ncbi:hypothetical protein RvY_02451-2 [Ramazzottius varieornatus]|uniref:SAC3/GANP/THP3 conserved domain-containing protein n=3 Tax=Ramazzottius varieornatus TaxID=947166 RepID=A0A1D1UKI0_RAMVA|nr:hypothetical protein RvY_02451-2 [Ramazzottius varieornatus]
MSPLAPRRELEYLGHFRLSQKICLGGGKLVQGECWVILVSGGTIQLPPPPKCCMTFGMVNTSRFRPPELFLRIVLFSSLRGFQSTLEEQQKQYIFSSWDPGLGIPKLLLGLIPRVSIFLPQVGRHLTTKTLSISRQGLSQKRFANAPPNHPPSSSFSASSYSYPPSSTPTNTQPDSSSGRSSSPSPASSPPKSQNSGLNIRSDDWPVSLQNYVAKAIAVTPPEKTSHVMQTITQMITNAYKTNTLHTCKWEKAPMPYADDASNELFGLSPKRENSPPTFRSSSGRGRGGRPALRRGRVSNRRSDSDESGDEKSSQVSSSSRARNGKSSSPRGGDFPGEDYLSLRKGGSSSSTKKGKKGTQTGPRGKLLGFGAETPMTEEDQAKLRKRQERFGDVSKTSSDSLSATATSVIRSNSKPRKTKSPVASSSNPLRDRAKLAQRGKSGQRAVVGTCQTVEKEYFRLTEEAEPSLIRPLNILEQALDVVRDNWKRKHNYRYAESQLKSIRQDLRVQHIFSPFTVKVYEMHARIALEVGDQAEFTQCLAQLEWLYDTLSAVYRKTGSSAGAVAPGCENRREFLSYRILYVMRQNRTTDMTRVRSQLSDEDKKDTCIAFAFSVLSAYFAGDYQQYFSLHKNAPMMAGYVMDVSTPIFRQKMLIKICAAYRPNLPVMALKDILCFSSEPELRDFLKAYRLTYTWMNGAEEIDCKASLAVVKAGPEILQPVETQAQPQAPPPPKPKLVTSTPLRTSSKTRRRIAVSTA